MRYYTLPILLIANITGIYGFTLLDFLEAEAFPILFLIAVNFTLISLSGKLFIRKKNTIERLKPVRIK